VANSVAQKGVTGASEKVSKLCVRKHFCNHLVRHNSFFSSSSTSKHYTFIENKQQVNRWVENKSILAFDLLLKKGSKDSFSTSQYRSMH